MSDSLAFSCALITGGGGGIGQALASYLINTHKTKVLVAGRTESTLSASAREIEAACYYVLDVGDTAGIAPCVAKKTAEDPELDCLIHNAEVQRPLDMQREAPAAFVDKAENTINIDVKGPLHLTVGLLPPST